MPGETRYNNDRHNFFGESKAMQSIFHSIVLTLWVGALSVGAKSFCDKL